MNLIIQFSVIKRVIKHKMAYFFFGGTVAVFPSRGVKKGASNRISCPWKRIMREQVRIIITIPVVLQEAPGRLFVGSEQWGPFISPAT